MFHPESNPLAPKSSGPKKPEKDLVEIWLGKEAAELMGDEKQETGNEEGLNSKKYKLTEKELWKLRRPDEVTLKNIPKREELRNEVVSLKDFKLQQSEHSEPSLQECVRIGSDQRSKPAEVLPYAKVFDIVDAIAKAKENDPKHPPWLTSPEVLNAINEAGYLPATLEELLAYARDYWKPDVDPDTLTKEERVKNAHAKYICGLGTVIQDVYYTHFVPDILHNFIMDEDREFSVSVLDSDDTPGKWSAESYFLVLRKASS